MRKLILTTALILFAAPAMAATIKAEVNGLVCAFCAAGIEKTFKAQPEVSDVKVSLEERQVTIRTKDNQTLDDAKVKQLITDAGFDVTAIHRE